jgi:hypothetical protein
MSVMTATSAAETFTVQYLKDQVYKGNGEFLVIHLHSPFLDDLLSIFSL